MWPSFGRVTARGAFPWHDPDSWDLDLLQFYQMATKMRRSHRVLRLGGFQRVPIQPSDDGVASKADELYAFVRWCSHNGEAETQTAAVVVFNSGFSPGNNSRLSA